MTVYVSVYLSVTVFTCRDLYPVQINSPVLTEQSPWIEYYYRSLKSLDPDPGSGRPHRVVSYYNKSNILDLVRQYQVR